MTERGPPKSTRSPASAGGGPSNGADGNFLGNRPCEFCGAKAPVWDIRVFRREDQTEPDFRLTVCEKCLPLVNAKLEERAKRETWTSETWDK